jgi:DNA-binding SARP family transcriptional activator
MEFRLLGSLEVLDGQRVVRVGGGKRRSLLALLVLHRNEVVSADRLIDALWGESPPPTAAKGLQVHVSQLRKELQPHSGQHNGQTLATHSNGYVLHVGPDDLDVERFERALDAGERALAAGEPDRAAQRLGEGLAMWRGPPLADFAYEPFAQQEIARLEELRLVALGQRIDADLALGRHAQVVGELEALVREHPLREHICAQLMVALYRCGRQAEALEAYRDLRRRMSDELGLEPGPALRELEGKVLAQSADLAPPAPPAAPATPPRKRAPPPAAETPSRRASRLPTALVLLGAAVLVGAVGVFLAVRDDQGASTRRTVALDLAKDQLVGVSASTRGPDFAVPLPGRPTGLAAARGRVFVVTVDSAALTIIDARTRAIVRQVPLSLDPGAVAVEGDRGWVLDRRRGLVLGFTAGYERPSLRIRYDRGPGGSVDTGLGTLGSASLATGAGAVWVTDGSSLLRRIDPRSGTISEVRAGRPLDGVTTGEGAAWAFSARTASVVRVEPDTNAVTDVPIVARHGSDAPFPIGIATTPGSVWVLNGNTATVTQIDARQGGVIRTIPVGMDRLPRDIAASGRTVWIANFDGSVSRIAPGARTPGSLWVGQSLNSVAVDGERVWVTTTALDQQLPGGTG